MTQQLWLGLAVLDQHDWTKQAVDSLRATTTPDNFHLVLYDQASDVPYERSEFPDLPFPLTIVRLAENISYYRTVHEIAQLAGPDDLIGMIHNDLVIYEAGWNEAVHATFTSRPKLGMLGFAGAWVADWQGGRAGSLLINFQGKWAKYPQTLTNTTGQHVAKPVVTLDSLAMFMPRSIEPLLGIDEHTTMGHFLDHAWPLKLWDQGYEVGYLGIQIDHAGSVTTIGDNRKWEDTCRTWCEREEISPYKTYYMHENLPARHWMNKNIHNGWQTLLYVETEDRFLREFNATKQLPSWVDPAWNYHRGLPTNADLKELSLV